MRTRQWSGAGAGRHWLTHLEYQWRNLSGHALLTALSQHYTVLRYDARGCELSEWNVSDISLDA